jgi:hypothetical protein
MDGNTTLLSHGSVEWNSQLRLRGSAGASPGTMFADVVEKDPGTSVISFVKRGNGVPRLHLCQVLLAFLRSR